LSNMECRIMGIDISVREEKMDRYIIPSVFQAVQLCEVLANSNSGLRASDIEHALKIPRSTVFRLIRTLLGARVIDKKGTRYVYGRRIYEVTATDMSRRSAQQELVSPLAALIKGHECSALIGIPSENGALVVDVIDASLTCISPYRPGAQLGLFDSALGQIVLAHYSFTFYKAHQQTVDAIKSAETSLASKIRTEICTRGFSITYCSKKENTLLAVPVFSVDGELSAILSLYFSESIKDVLKIQQWTQKLKSIACIQRREVNK